MIREHHEVRILKNNEVDSGTIKQIRKIVMSENKETKFFLGINSSNITETLPIKNRNFNIWVLYSDENHLIGFLTFEDKENEVKFLKVFYIASQFRKQEFGKLFINRLYEMHPKLECKINLGNDLMCKLVKSVKMRNEKSAFNFLNTSKDMSIWWSNYNSDDDYK